jgi:hypothetical protein
MIDRPKRRCEAITGIIIVSSYKEHGDNLLKRWARTHKQMRDEFGIHVNCSCDFWGLSGAPDDFGKGLRMDFNATAIVTKEGDLARRWARALDQIRREYGLTLEWEETEIEERGQTIASWVESQRLQSYEKPDFMNQYEKKVRDALLNAPSVFSLPAGVEVKTTGGDDSTTVKYEASADGINWFATAESAAALRSEPDNRVLIKDEVDINPERFKEAAAAGAELREKHAHRFSEASTPTPKSYPGKKVDIATASRSAESAASFRSEVKETLKSYANTPTGTREWDEKVGAYWQRVVDGCGSDVVSFGDAFHMVPADGNDDDETFTDVACPICGETSLGNSMILDSKTIGKLLSSPISSGDMEVREELADTKCGNCHHLLKYDFDNETIEIRRPE